MDRYAGLALALLLATPALAADRAPPPSANCVDARSVDEVVQSDDYTLAVRLADGSRFRIDLAARCPGIAHEPGVRLVSPAGWVCGRPREAVASGPRACPVAHAMRIDSRTFAAHAVRAQGTRPPGVLDAVTVTARRPRGFLGSPAYCVNVNHMRGWHEDAQGIVVEVSPMRSGGNRFYRVELAGGCQDMTDAAHLTLKSGVGGAMVCGFAGDTAIFRHALEQAGYAGAFGARAAASGVDGQCAIAEVYPIDPTEERLASSVSPAP